MTVKLHQPVAGLGVGAEYVGPMEDWLVVNGYASRANDRTDKVDVTDVTPDLDPTNADNREAPGELFQVLGEEYEPDVAQLDPKPLHKRRKRIVGTKEDPEAAAQTAERDGRVNPDEVTNEPPVEQVEAEEAAEDAEGEGDPEHDEP